MRITNTQSKAEGSTVGELSHVSLVERVLQGDVFAWQDLVAQVHQIATKSAAHRGSDFAGNVALRTIERLEADKHRSLKGFMEALQTYPSLSFGRWLRTIIRNATVDELRGQPEFSRQRSEGKRVLAPRTHVLLDEQHGSIGGATGFHRALEVRRIVAWIMDASFPESQRRAILLWIDGHHREEIATIMSLKPKEVTRLLRASRQRLRRRFEVKL